MSTQEFKLRNLLQDATFFIQNSEEDETFIEKSHTCLNEADNIIRENTRESYIQLSPEVIVMFCEVALLAKDRDDDVQKILEMFFQRINQEDQFFCRALLAFATVEVIPNLISKILLQERKIVKLNLKAEENLKQVQLAYSYIKRALDIMVRPENKQKYQFLIYNASIKTWHIIRSLMKPGWSKNLVEMLEKVSALLEEQDDSDFNWRCRYLNALVKAMIDAEKKPEALKVLDKLYDLTKKKGECKFQETLFRNRLHLYKDNNGVLAAIKKDTEIGQDPNAFKSLFVIQQIKSGVIQEALIEKELTAIMSALTPASVSQDPVQMQQASKLSQIFQDRLAECGRIAAKYNFIQLCEGAINVINRARQGSLRAKVWCEYSKAEILIKKPTGDLDKKSGMKLNTFQKQLEDYDRRVEALKLMDRAMIANKRLQDPDIILEGCILIWNMGIPMLKKSSRQHIYKPFQTAAQQLEHISSNESTLRVCFHLELAKFEIEQDFLTKAKLQLQKALDIDYSLTMKQVQLDIKEDDDLGDFQRPYQKVLKFLLKKLSLKTNVYGGDPDTVHEQIILDVENAKTTRNVKMRETLLDKALKQLQEYEEPEFFLDPSSNLVEEEIKQEKKKFHLKNVREKKERVLISTEIAKLALEENLIPIGFDAATLAVQQDWDVQKNIDLIIAQSEAHLVLSKCYVEDLLEEDIEIPFKNLITVDDDQDERDFTNEDRAKYQEWKVKFTHHIIQSVKLAQQVQQSWLVFNSSIEFWNNYLPLFKKANFFELILAEGVPAMIECFEGMNNQFISATFNQENVDYELDKKMQVFANLSMMLARMYEFLNKNDDCIRTCDTLLSKQLPSHLRKTFDSIKARITKQVSNIGAAATKQTQSKPGAKDQPTTAAYQPSKAEIVTSEVMSQLELIQNGNKDLINKTMESLSMWSPNQQEEIELEMNAELWCRLGRLASNQNSIQFTKISLYCAQQCLSNGDEKLKSQQYQQIPITRLRWYAVAESLYGEALYKLLDTQKQEKDSQDKLLILSVNHFVESCQIGSKAAIGYLVLESAKLMWNALLPLLDAPNNRKVLIKPLTNVHQTLRRAHENSDPDFLVLIYSALFTCIAEEKDWKLGEEITEEAFQYVPQTHSKVLWEAKMLFLSKLGKNVLNAISNMKESNQSLMAKVWVKLARSSSNQMEQHSAYNKAIEILRKEESVEVVEVLIEYAEWLQRFKFSSQDVEDQLQLAVEILMDIEPGWDDEDEETLDGDEDEAKTKKTGKSRSSRLSKQSKTKTKISKIGGQSKRKSKVGGQTKVSKATKRSAALKSRTGSKSSKKTSTALSKRQEEDGQPMFLNCSHFEKLIRIHSMLATLAPDAYKQREFALDAHFFIMKVWEQSFQTLNAITFFEDHKAEVEELGFTQTETDSRRQYFAEIFTNSEIQIPVKFNLPEKAEDWTGFSVPEEFFKKIEGHEDKLMVSKWTFIKPELTFYHLMNVLKILDEHYFTVQSLPVLELAKLFGKAVLEDKKIEDIMNLKKSRLFLNIGMKQESEQIKQQWEENRYKLTDEEKKLNLEKIKALKDKDDNMKDKNVIFLPEDDHEIWVLENFRIHETWILYALELMKQGEVILAKDFIMETHLHARILKDQDNYAMSLQLLSSIAYLEGESASALRCDMLCHQYAKNMGLVEDAIEHTFDLMLKFNKVQDCVNLITQSISMLENLRNKQNAQDTQTTQMTKAAAQNNLPLDAALGSIYLLKAIICMVECQESKGFDDQAKKVEESFSFIDLFEVILQRSGFKQSHLIKLLRYCRILQEESGKEVGADVNRINFVKVILEKNAKVLLRVQELITNQVYYVGLHIDSNIGKLTLPILRMLGIVKLRIAQVNTSIGIIKNSIKLSSSTSIDSEKKLDRVVETFMDAVTKQIEAQTNTYKSKMNRYEKSISILYSALNMIHSQSQEYSEVLVEISKNKRLLAVNKKHLRGQWRQDAIEVDKVNMKNIREDEQQDDAARKEELQDKGLRGEVIDHFVDYKEEALKNFVDILEGANFSKILENIGLRHIDNVLGTFSLEYSECRGNLNKEQAFFFLALYQYSVSRQHMYRTYLDAATEKHPDILKLRQLQYIKEQYCSFSSPFMPKTYTKIEEDLKESSKPYKILNSYYPIEDFKENLPHSGAYLLIQLSEDKQFLYYGFLMISKERKLQYYISKITLSDIIRSKLFQMVDNLAQTKIAMQKTPITIQEDLDNLEKDSEEEIQKLVEDMEMLFEPISQTLNDLINPNLKGEEEEVVQQQPGSKVAPAGKKDDKKAPPAKGQPKGGQKGELASYESNLPLSASGIENLVIFLDSRIDSLPIEQLKVFSKIPVVSRDFNLHMYMQRVKAVGHQAPLHNNTGIAKENLKYIVDAPQPLEAQSQKLMQQEAQKLLANSKWEGILSKQQHIPSEGEWERLISSSSLFLYFSMTSLMHKFPSSLVSDLSIFSKCKAIVILDRMNSFKTLVDRNVLTSKHYVPNEQPIQQAILFSLCGVSTILTNHWPVQPEANFEMMDYLLKGALQDGVYLGAALRKYKESGGNEKKNIYKLNPVTFGVPIIRIV